MPRYDDSEKTRKRRKGATWNLIAFREPPPNPQGNYSDILPRISKDSDIPPSLLVGPRGDIRSPPSHHNHQAHSSQLSHRTTRPSHPPHLQHQPNSLSQDQKPTTLLRSHNHAPNPQKLLETHEDSTLKSNIHVLVRIRPKRPSEKGPAHRIVARALGDRLVVFDPKEPTTQEEFYFHGIKQKTRHDYTKKPRKNLKFSYDRVYGPENTNVEIFETSMKKLVSHVIEGFNCSVFAYGATGAGKTYTMLGSFEHPGLTFLMAMELYNRLKGMSSEYESEIVVSYLEVYNETLRDLLHPSGVLTIREDGFNGVNIPNLTMHKPKDASELLGMLSYGNSVRTQHPTDQNAESSRSHAVFQVFVSLRKRFTHRSLSYKMAKAKLVMVDLAGSERGLPGTDSQRFREGANINKSLLALSNCINALADGKKHIPYRDSKLTRILKDSLGGNSKTVMIANVSPSFASFDDTYNTLKYAGRAKEIRTSCKKNSSYSDPANLASYSQIVDDLQLEIYELKLQLERERELRRRFQNGQLDDDETIYPNKTRIISACPQHHHQHPPPSPLNQPRQPQPQQVGESGDSSTTARSASQEALLPPIIPDPITLENFIQLLTQKKKLEEDHTEASIALKECQWSLLWKRWKLEGAKFLSKSMQQTNQQRLGDDTLSHHPPSPRHKIHLMKTECEERTAKSKLFLDKLHLAKQVLDFNEKEIDLVGGQCLNNFSMEDPFLTVTLREFLYYKSLERQVTAHKTLENYHHKMSLTIFEKLVAAETMLSNSCSFLNYMYLSLQDQDAITDYMETKREEIFSPFFGSQISFKLSNKDPATTSLPSHLLHQLWDMMRSPVVEYEDPTSSTTRTTCSSILNDFLGHPQENHLDSTPACENSALHPAPPVTHTSSMENSCLTGHSSSNDLLTIHHPEKYLSTESLVERDTTARTIPFTADASQDSHMTVDDSKTRETTVTDFEEIIQQSDSNLLDFHPQNLSSQEPPPPAHLSSQYSRTSPLRPTTTVVSSGQIPNYAQPWIQYQRENLQRKSHRTTDYHHSNPSNLLSFNDASSSAPPNKTPSPGKSSDSTGVQVSESQLHHNPQPPSPRPSTFSYPNDHGVSHSHPYSRRCE